MMVVLQELFSGILHLSDRPNWTEPATAPGVKLHPLLRARLRDEIGDAAARELKTEVAPRFVEAASVSRRAMAPADQ
jgi:hypothetical protein